MTLIEVVAAIAILGMVLVGVVVAKAQHTHQLALAVQREAAVLATDELIGQWWAGGRHIPANEHGSLATEQPLQWATHEVANSAIEELGARVIRLEIRNAKDERVLMVDLVTPLPDESNSVGRRP